MMGYKLFRIVQEKPKPGGWYPISDEAQKELTEEFLSRCRKVEILESNKHLGNALLWIVNILLIIAIIFYSVWE